MEESLPPKHNSPHEHKGACDTPAPTAVTRSKWEMPGFSARLKRAEAAKLPKATTGRPPVALTRRDLGERVIGNETWGLGLSQSQQGWQTPCSGRDTSPRREKHPIAVPLRNTRPKVFQNTNPLSTWGQTSFLPWHLVRAPSCVSVTSYHWVL